MTAYNAEKYITDALQSVLMQSFDDFEFIIVDDGSSDATWQILNGCSDNRLIILRNEHDYIASLNCAMHMARGEYIVRMDADDMMHPDRLSMQVSLMEQNPELDVCTTWMEGFDLRGMHYVAPSAKGKLEHPLLHLLHKNNLYHPTAIIRSSFWKAEQRRACCGGNPRRKNRIFVRGRTTAFELQRKIRRRRDGLVAFCAILRKIFRSAFIRIPSIATQKKMN